MTTTRYFEVKVTGCKNCHECYSTYDETWGVTSYSCGHANADVKDKILFQQNKDQLTPTCPMWNETEESETQDAS